MIIETDGNVDGTDCSPWVASNRLRYQGAPLLASVIGGAAGEKSVFRMVAQVQGGIPPRREPH